MKQLIFIPILISVSLFIFYLLLPFKFIDHNESKITCQKNNASYKLGPNLIFALDEKLDSLTDKNIRKLCEYAILNDYQDTYKTPTKINYHLELAYQQEGSWGDTVLISIGIFLLLSILFNTLGKLINHKSQIPNSNKLSNFKLLNTLAILLGLIFFLLFLYKPARHLYCERKIAAKMSNFQKSAYGYGLFRIQQEEIGMKPVLDQAFKKCVQ